MSDLELFLRVILFESLFLLFLLYIRNRIKDKKEAREERYRQRFPKSELIDKAIDLLFSENFEVYICSELSYDEDEYMTMTKEDRELENAVYVLGLMGYIFCHKDGQFIGKILSPGVLKYNVPIARLIRCHETIKV